MFALLKNCNNPSILLRFNLILILNINKYLLISNKINCEKLNKMKKCATHEVLKASQINGGFMIIIFLN